MSFAKQSVNTTVDKTLD